MTVDLQSEIMLKMSSMRCKCSSLMEAHPCCGMNLVMSFACQRHNGERWWENSPPLTFTRQTYDFVGHSAAKTAFTLPHWI